MRVAILCNGKDLALWQRRAVECIAAEHELYVLACPDPPPAARKARHFAYYALNLVTIRNRLTRRVPFPDATVMVVDRLDAQAEFDGNWAVLTDEMIGWLKARRIDAIVKFGLGLLRVPDPATLPIPILSYHHGDPARYRGRPAGFHELANGEPFVGQVVQILSNRLDAGRIVASAEARSVAHSYRRTLFDLYALSPYLLPVALRAVAAGAGREVSPGRNYRLPGNWEVMRFVAARWRTLAARAFYGAFVEKRWNVAWCDVPETEEPVSAISGAEAKPWQVPEIAQAYSFYADPFFDPDGEAILVEAMHRWTGKGQIVRLSHGCAQPLRGLAGHASYPICVEEKGQPCIVPEISEWSPPAILGRDADRLVRLQDLDIDAGSLIDPTPFEFEGRWYLFGCTAEDGPSILHLWTAESLFGRFDRHPASPIRVSARGSRMAGQILALEDRLYRLGQDCGKGYGNGILAFRIQSLSPTDYAELPVGAVGFESVRGPHTVNLRNGRLLFDFYVDRFSLLAGIRRAAGRL